FMMLMTLAILLLLRRRPALSGIALGLAALTRPVALIGIPLFALFLGAPAARRLVRRRPAGEAAGGPAAGPAALLFFAALLTIAPWTIRNFVHYHRLIVINDAGP